MYNTCIVAVLMAIYTLSFIYTCSSHDSNLKYKVLTSIQKDKTVKNGEF
jgi:hypothetical protein